MNSEKRNISEDLRMIKRGSGIIKELSPRLLCLSLLNSLLSAIIPYISIYISAIIIDELVGKRNLHLILIYVAIAVGGSLVLSVISNLMMNKINVMKVMLFPKVRYYLNAKKLSMDFIKLEDPKYTELRAKITGNMLAMGGGITALVDLMTSIASNIVSILFAIIILVGTFLKSGALKFTTVGVVNSVWFLCLLFLIIAVCVVLTIRNARTENKKDFNLFRTNSTNRYLNYYHFRYMEDDQAAKDIRIFDQRNLIIHEIFSKGRLPWLNIITSRYSLQQKYFGANAAISAFIGGIAYIFIGLKALSKSISLGDVTKSYASIIKMVSAVSDLSFSFSQIRNNNNYLELFFEFIDTPSESHNGTEIPARNNNDWEIEFHNVCFRYPFCEEYALKNVSFKISTKSRVSIVGMNGSGKTTMIKLLCGLYVPETGHITLNGKDISKYDYDAYLNLFAVLFQDFKLLAFPIGQNVATSIDYDDAKVWNSLELAGISDRVNSLPLKLNQTIYRNVKEDGIEISGGEEQKIAIARALYKNAPIYIFDEPTAALDPISEYEIYSKFNEIIGDKTALFVSHRLSSCRFCNTIIVFDNGQIVQMGYHDELLKDIGGKYYELWSAQAQYYQ
ncbi:ABC transporter ATP-binding protein [Anaerocolumna sp. MB42-C2]|uniref:ABC transporter ATP-binding protein n=1 Tax=Anaerocolumna sp. MB42-C2 TaxID=3070997 RepID=UPI0027E0F226|nr:ABC transporter ATP-binding protein [Anaerocolumna sp. MB42-C2]WMJ86429.1 ABC transporter ATP-binding protein [Anaerocolumna sp. MB42-C2]